MSQKYRRFSLKTKEAKQILAQASEKVHLNLENIYGARPSVETAEANTAQIFLINGNPLFYKEGCSILPTLLANEIHSQLPKIVVDMGAIPHVCNGADIMAPGIVQIEGEFSKCNLVLIVDEKHSKPLAIGEALISSAEAQTAKKGLVAKNLHYVGDEIWNLAKILVQ